ncbi:hypothetical protein [Mesorhizobium sp. M1393]
MISEIDCLDEVHPQNGLFGQRGPIGGTKSWVRGFAPREDKVRVSRRLHI